MRRTLSGRIRFFIGVLAICGSATAEARDTWLKVSTPEVTVITTVGTREATACASEFVQYIAALRGFLGNTPVELPPLTIVLFSRPQDFQRYLPILARDGSPQPVGGFFARHEAWAIVGLPPRVSDDSRRAIFHEGVHWFLSATNTRNPLWVEEGLAEVFSTFRAEKGVAEWGRAIEPHVKLLRAVSLPPLEKLSSTMAGELYGNERVRTGVVYAQSWAFVHFLIFGKHEIPRKAILSYLEATSGGMTRDEAFRTIFGGSFADMDRQLRAYLNAGSYLGAKQPLLESAKPTVQPATLLEVENALGRLALAGKRTAQAMSHGGAALANAPDDPRGHELLALALAASGDKDGALTEFEAAIACGSQDFQPYFEVAAATHGAAIKMGRAVSPAEARSLANRYQRAIGFYPKCRPAYENLAGLAGAIAPLRQEDRSALELGRRLFPESFGIELGLAQLARRSGDVAGARASLDHVLAARANLTRDTLVAAERLDQLWQFEDLGRQLEQLGRAGKFEEAIALVDAGLARATEPVRGRLSPMRDQLQAALFSRRVKQALDAKQWPQLRRALQDLLASSAPEPMKIEARRTLAQLDDGKLGLEPENAPASPK